MRRILSENTPITTWDEATRLFESLVVEEGSAGGFRGENGELYNKRVDIISSWNKVAKEQAAYNIGDMLQTVSGGRGAAGKEEQADAQEKARALGYALATGSVKLAEKMVRHGAEVEAALKARYSAGCYYYGVNGAMRGGNWLGSGESDYTRDKKYAASYYSDHPLFQLLYDMKEERFHETLKWLLSKKPDMANILNEPIDELGAALLIVMARDGYKGLPAVPTIPPAPVEAVAWLLKHGADPNVQDMDGKTALDYATDKKKKALLRAAVKKAGK